MSNKNMHSRMHDNSQYHPTSCKHSITNSGMQSHAQPIPQEMPFSSQQKPLAKTKEQFRAVVKRLIKGAGMLNPITRVA